MLSRTWQVARLGDRSPLRRAAFSRRVSTKGKAEHNALRVLFCGADDFSIYSLRALHELQRKQPDRIDAIEVICRPDKRVGRGLKQVQAVPIKPVANKLGLKLHQIDTFTGWSPKDAFNLVVAVSFGLLVPARILTGAKYGGLNIHPSLLPDLRGPAPIQHALLKQRSHTGVTLQTMHPTKFDHGAILAQTPLPGVPVPDDCTPDQLLNTLGPQGAEMLCKAIEDELFVPPIHDLGSGLDSRHISHAPKIMRADRHIDWATWTAKDVIVRDRVLGRLWDESTFAKCHSTLVDGPSKRVNFSGPWKVQPRNVGVSEQRIAATPPGTPVMVETSNGIAFGIATASHDTVSPAACTIEGQGRNEGLKKLADALGRDNAP